MRNMDFTYFLSSFDSDITTPIRIFLSGHGVNCDCMKQLIVRLQTCPQPVQLHFSNSGITVQSAILLAQSLYAFKQPLTLYFSKTDLEKSGECISVFTTIANRHAFPIGTNIIGLTNYITQTCNLHIMLAYTKILFALSPYKTDAEDKTKKTFGFPRDIAQVVLGFLTTVPLDIAFTVRERISEERKSESNSCALS